MIVVLDGGLVRRPGGVAMPLYARATIRSEPLANPKG